MNHEPHPESLLRALQALECAPHTTIMIGDSAADILAGKAAGTRTALSLIARSRSSQGSYCTMRSSDRKKLTS